MYRLLILLLLAVNCRAQTVPFQQLLIATAGQLPAPTVQHHSVGGCGGGSTTCTLTGQVIGTTGNAAYVLVLGGCWNSGCSTVTPACGLAVSDGTNTYTSIAAASIINSTATSQYSLVSVAGNATAGTRTITVTASGTGCSLNYSYVFFVDVGGAAASPVDTAVSNTTLVTSGAVLSLTSAGNVAFVNELIIAGAGCFNTGPVASTSSYASLDVAGNNGLADFTLSSPTQGSTTTFTGSCPSSQTWSVAMVGLHP